MKVADIMTHEFEVVHQDKSLLEAMKHLEDCPYVADEIGIKCVIVLDEDDQVAGILTQSDVVGEILLPYFVRDLANATESAAPALRTEDFRALGAFARKVKVRDVMTRDVVTLSADEDLFAAADTVVSRKVKSVPVVDDEGRVAGVLYRSKLYRTISEGILEASAE